MGKLKYAICQGCRKPIGRHDKNRYSETIGVPPRHVEVCYHLACWQKKSEKD